MRRSDLVMRAGLGALLLLVVVAGCGGDDGDSVAEEGPTTTTTAAPLATYRQQYLVLFTASECNAKETDAVQAEISANGVVEPDDFPAIQARLQPAWAARAEAVAQFQDGLANADWSAELDPLVDALIDHLEEIRAVYRSGSTVDSFEEFGTLIFPGGGTAEQDLHEALELPARAELDDVEWCNGVPAL